MKIKQSVIETLNQHGLKPKKLLGQNFLINEKIYEDIIKAAEIKKGDMVLEIGPGLGTLTDYIAQAVGEKGKVAAVEKDDQFVKILSDRFGRDKNVKIVNEDILKLNFQFSIFPPTGGLPRGDNFQTTPDFQNYKIVGNIPYYLTSRLLKTIFEKWPRPEGIVMMVQKEVAQRIIAKPPKSSLLSVGVQFFSKPEIIRTVKKENFWPRPRVDSAIIRLAPSQQFPFENHQLFFKVVRAGFSGKRKQLINSLANGLKVSKQAAEKILKSAEVEPTRRAETVSIPEWIKIAKIYSFHY